MRVDCQYDKVSARQYFLPVSSTLHAGLHEACTLHLNPWKKIYKHVRLTVKCRVCLRKQYFSRTARLSTLNAKALVLDAGSVTPVSASEATNINAPGSNSTLPLTAEHIARRKSLVLFAYSGLKPQNRVHPCCQ